MFLRGKTNFLIFTVIGFVLLFYLCKQYDVKTIVRTMYGIKMYWLLGGILTGGFAHVINGLRIRICLEKRFVYLDSVAISAVHMFLLNLMPLRSGEVSYVLLTRKYAGCSSAEAIAGLVIQRIFDLTILMAMIIISCGITFYAIKPLFILTCVLACGTLIVVLFCSMFLKSGSFLVSKSIALFGDNHVLIKAFVYVGGIFDEFRRRYRRKLIIKSAVMSLIYWVVVLLQTYMLFCAFQPLEFHYFLVLFAIVNLWAIVPVHGFLAIGTIDYAFVFVLAHMGVAMNNPVEIVIGFRISMLLCIILNGGVGAAVLLLRSSTPWQGKVPPQPGKKNGKVMIENTMEKSYSIDDALLDRIIRMQGSYFSKLSGIDPVKIARDLVNPVKARNQAGILQRFIKIKDKKLLEIGSGCGMNLIVWAKEFGADVFGVEPDSSGFTSSCTIAQLLFRRNDIDTSRMLPAIGENLPFRNASFDIVYSANVLEHTGEPERVIDEAMRVLKPDGLFQCVYPNYHSFFDGHYAVFHPPVFTAGFFPWYVEKVWRRDPEFALTLRTELNMHWTYRMISRLKSNHHFEVLSYGGEVFKDRMLTTNFETWSGLTKVMRVVLWARKIGLHRIAAEIMLRTKTWTPIILTIRKKS